MKQEYEEKQRRKKEKEREKDKDKDKTKEDGGDKEKKEDDDSKTLEKEKNDKVCLLSYEPLGERWMQLLTNLMTTDRRYQESGSSRRIQTG